MTGKRSVKNVDISVVVLLVVFQTKMTESMLPARSVIILVNQISNGQK